MFYVAGYNHTGTFQPWVCPPGTNSVYVELWGAPGGALEYYSGWTPATDIYGNSNTQVAPGGYIAGQLSLAPGQYCNIVVGGRGGDAAHGNANTTIPGGAGGWNGGGRGGKGHNDPGTLYAAAPGSGGGGATDFRAGGTGDVSERQLVAGGGGGQGGTAPLASAATVANPTTPDPPYGSSLAGGTRATYYPAGTTFGGGGGPTGTKGGAQLTDYWTQEGNAAGGGDGGNASAGGAGGVAGGGWGVSGTNGALDQGGQGADAVAYVAGPVYNAGGGGGGGGYYGGGGGSVGQYGGGGGGGGSNWCIGGAWTNVVSYPNAWPPAEAGASGAGGFARLSYHVMPNPPNILSTNGVAAVAGIDPTEPFTIVFQHVGTAYFPNVNYASSFDIAIQDVTAGGAFVQTHVAISPIWPGIPFTYPAGTFVAGHAYNLRVRTYDIDLDVSPWTTIGLYVDSPPAAPIVTNTPAGTVTVAEVTTSWTNPASDPQVDVQLQWLDADSVVVHTAEIARAEGLGVRVNECVNPALTTDTSGWAADNTDTYSVTFSRSTTYSPTPGGGSSLMVEWPAGGAGVPVGAITGFPVRPGAQYRAEFQIASSDPSGPPVSVGVGGLVIGGVATGGATLGGPRAPGATLLASTSAWDVTAGVFQTVEVTFVGDASGAMFAGVYSDAEATVYVGCVMVEEVTGPAGPWFDGSHLNGNDGTVAWTGTANDSPSILTPTDIVLDYTWETASVAPHNEDLTVEVRYRTVGNNVWSYWGSSASIFLDVNPPGTPEVVLTTDNTWGSATFAITFSDSPNTTLYAELFRTDVTNGGAEVRIAAHILPDETTREATFVDNTLATDTEYAYRLRVWSVLGGYLDYEG